MSKSGGWEDDEGYGEDDYGYDEDPDEAYDIVKRAIGTLASPAQIEAALEKANWNSKAAIDAIKKAAAAAAKAKAAAAAKAGGAAAPAAAGSKAATGGSGAAAAPAAAAAKAPASAAASAAKALPAAPAPLPPVPAEIVAYYGAAGRPAVLRSSSAAAGGATPGLSRAPSSSVPASPLPAAAAGGDAAAASGAKPRLSVVTIGHVDAGKSTLMGHLLASLGVINPRQLAKLAKDAATVGKGSFAFAWVLDDGATERERGVTVDVACNAFETAKRSFTLLDAPGHRDFVPNTITAIAQADVAVLVIDASPGEFEMSVAGGGQAAEHVLLARNLGISQMVVAVNKMDGPLVRWSADRFFEIVDSLALVLQTAGFKRENVAFVPVSGLTGVNLVKSAEVLATEVASSGAVASAADGAGAGGRAPSAPPAPSAASLRRASGFAAGEAIRWDPALVGASAAARALVGSSASSAAAGGAGAGAGAGGSGKGVARAPSSAFDDDDEPRGRRAHGEKDEDLSDMLEGLGFDSAPSTPAAAEAAASAGGSSSRAAAPTDTAVAAALSGSRAMQPSEIRLLTAWYQGPTLLSALEAVPLPPGLLEAPLRLSVADAYKGGFGGAGSGVMIAGRIEGGYVVPGAKLVVVPGMHTCAVKGILINGRPVPFAAAGDNVEVQVGGLELDVTPVFAGAVLCWASHPIAMVSRLKAKIVTFPGLEMPVLPGQQFMLHSHAAEEPCNVTRLLRTLDREGHTKVIKPRALGPNTVAVVRVALPRPIPLETFAQHPRLGRFVLRYGGQTIAAGMILKVKA